MAKRNNDEPEDKALQRLKQMEDARKPVPDEEGKPEPHEPDENDPEALREDTNQNEKKLI